MAKLSSKFHQRKNDIKSITESVQTPLTEMDESCWEDCISRHQDERSSAATSTIRSWTDTEKARQQSAKEKKGKNGRRTGTKKTQENGTHIIITNRANRKTAAELKEFRCMQTRDMRNKTLLLRWIGCWVARDQSDMVPCTAIDRDWDCLVSGSARLQCLLSNFSREREI